VGNTILFCDSERNEESFLGLSPRKEREILRFAQNDKKEDTYSQRFTQNDKEERIYSQRCVRNDKKGGTYAQLS
jgi:hypothetical protein